MTDSGHRLHDTGSESRGAGVSAPPANEPRRIALRGGAFVVVGDLQPTSGLEVWRESNPAERRTILREVSKEKPDFLVFLGDLVFCGSSAAAWADFDRLCAPLRSGRIPLYPVLGNHEYWLARRPALANYFGRFPHLGRRHWYAVCYGPLGLAFLDSNARWLARAAWQEQRDWYEQLLQRWDADPEIRGALVVLHHPPFTNSRVTADTLHVQRDFVPAFSRAQKTMAMISGHVHSYERFLRDGKTYLVAGGGGGPRAPLAEGARRRHGDDLFSGGALRAFHYLRMRPDADGLEVEVRGLDKGASGFQDMDGFRIAWPGPGGS